MEIKDYIFLFILYVFMNGITAGVIKYLNNKIGNLPTRQHEIDIEDLKALKSHELQVDSYYRNISVDKISELFEEWYEFLFDNDGLTLEGIKKTINKTLLYGSGETIRRLAIFQNNNYSIHGSGETESENKIDSEDTYVSMYLISYILSSLKKDFTGEVINPDDLLKIKINDYDSNRKTFEAAHEKAKKLLSIS